MNSDSANMIQLATKMVAEADQSESISGLCRTDFAIVMHDATVADAVRKIRESNLPDEVSNMVFMVDAASQYQGFVRLSRLLRSDDSITVSELLEGRDISLPESTHRETAARQLQRLDISSLPITDNTGRLIGILRFDDAMEILEEETSEGIYHKAGLGTLAGKDRIRSEKLTAGPLHCPIGVRLTFLMVTLAGGLMVGGLVDFFEDTLQR